MGHSRSSTHELSESSSGSTKDPLEQEHWQEQELGNNNVKLLEGVFTERCDDTLENNNDHCDGCSGVGRFVCCESCPKAFHFSCCQPPLDPENLPDEWFCTECRVTSNPPKPSPPGIFKELLDSINRSEPKAFELPKEVRSYFRGVETNNAGGYVDAMDFKPKDA
ncbi:hypothetical protein BGX24_012538 [Mortierella sp. AD032]|nr:hypothetical protein BGX24_012538 [Mortierella sp. AD032]